jgi:hypothetical protein
MIASMMLAGLRVRDQDVFEIARLLRDAGFDDTAERLDEAWNLETRFSLLRSMSAKRSSARSTRAQTDSRSSAVTFCASGSGA